MKTSFILLLSILFFSFVPENRAQVNNDWQWMHPKPQGNDIRFIKIVSPTNWVTVGYTGTLMRTTNAGVNWLVYTNYFGYYASFLGQGKNIYGAAFTDANTGIACGTQGWIARTTNGGISWDSIGSSAGTTALWNAGFGDANTVYIGGNSGMVLKSTNTGLNWTNVASPSGNANRTIFALDAGTVFTGSLNGIIYKSSNGGSSWTTIVTGSTTQIIFGIYFFNANTGIVSGGSGYVRYTTDGGNTWNTPSVFPAATETRIYARKNPDEIYLLGDVNNIYKSTDYTATWSTIPYQYPGQVIGLASNTMDISGNTWVVGGVNGLLNLSTTSGSSWIAMSNVFTDYNIFDVGYVPGTQKIWTVGNTAAGRNNSILYSTNNGASFQVQPSISGVYLRSIYMINENSGWITGNDGVILRTTNGGINWNTVSIQNAAGSITKVEFVNSGTGWIFGYGYLPQGSIWKTTDGGATWIEQIHGSNTEGVKWASAVDPNTCYYITGTITNTAIFKTTNGGSNWNQLSYPSPGNLWWIKMVSANTGYVCGDAGRLYRTTDGSAWNQVSTPTSNNYTTTDWTDINNGVLGAGSGFTARTTNGGQSWSIYNTGGSSVWSLRMIHPDTIWAAQGFGFLHKFIRGLTPVVEWRNSVPSAFLLRQNYPNPFNPSTTIEFSLLHSGTVTLKVYDISGRLVNTLIDGLNLNPGTVKVVFDGSLLSSGVYFYRLETESYTQTKKMMLVK